MSNTPALINPANHPAIFTSQPEVLDLIDTYVKYADIFEAPPNAHAAAAISAVAGAVNDNVWIVNGGQVLTLDLWILLLSGSGVGRNTLLSLLRNILKEAGLSDLERNTSWGSKQGFYQDLQENPRGMFIWEELSVALKALSEARFVEAKQWLTNLYDNPLPPPSIKYRTGGEE